MVTVADELAAAGRFFGDGDQRRLASRNGFSPPGRYGGRPLNDLTTSRLRLLLIPWALLLVPSVPLSMHDCHGFVGLVAHSPLYAFVALTASLVAVAAVALVRGSSAPASDRRGEG